MKNYYRHACVTSLPSRESICYMYLTSNNDRVENYRRVAMQFSSRIAYGKSV